MPKKIEKAASPALSPSENLSPEDSTSQKTKKSNEKAVSKSFRLGKDEMNLVEHPFAVLKRGATGSVIHLEWEKKHPRTGKTIKAHWRIEGSGELGLPGPVEERLYLVMMELSREQGFPEQVMFSSGDILRRLGIADAAKNYAMLHDAFLRLTSVTIDAKNSFWLAQADDFAASVMFGLVDEVKTTEEGGGRRKGQVPLALSSFRWSQTMYSSIVAGNIRSLSIDFALSLELPLSARLFRYLDKHRTGDKDQNRNKFEIELFRLCEIHLGMTRARYASKLKERLAPAFQELKQRGFLADVQFEPMKSQESAEKVVFYFTNGLLNADGEVEMPATVSPEIEYHTLHAIQSEEVLVAPAPTGFSPIDLILSWDMEDEEARNAACDAVFEELDATTREKIENGLWEIMPPFLQNNRSLPGARSTLARHRRARVLGDYADRVRAVLEEAARAETGATKVAGE